MSKRGPRKGGLFAIWIVLLALLFLTWSVAQFNLGRWNIVAAVSIAVAKMLLVILFFMQVHYSPRLTWVFVMAGFFWLLILFTLTMADYLTRGGLRFH
jgi:cytochrome c oxidase subunit 4